VNSHSLNSPLVAQDALHKQRAELIELAEALELRSEDSTQGALRERFESRIQIALAAETLHLGPFASAWLPHEGRPFLLSRLRSTVRISDAILGAVHDGQINPKNPEQSDQLQNEFWGHISTTLRRMAGYRPSSEDSVDLVQSAIASILGEGTRLEFRTQAQFLSYLLQRIRWNASNKAHRRRDKILMDNEASARVQDKSPGPATKAAEASLHGRARDRLAQFGERQQYLILARIDGTPMADQAKHLDLELSACRKASQRAWKLILGALAEEDKD
jgi:DNA-directed RNA polymerase specialized sigma24 family protein